MPHRAPSTLSFSGPGEDLPVMCMGAPALNKENQWGRPSAAQCERAPFREMFSHHRSQPLLSMFVSPLLVSWFLFTPSTLLRALSSIAHHLTQAAAPLLSTPHPSFCALGQSLPSTTRVLSPQPNPQQ
mmetsp:Transcript_22761/g.69619  ORF Transcript_22761/g.69619 Transcript_22761/m.69619 type:complete len:128 (+) Transcript_22761:261-644(+)